MRRRARAIRRCLFAALSFLLGCASSEPPAGDGGERGAQDLDVERWIEALDAEEIEAREEAAARLIGRGDAAVAKLRRVAAERKGTHPELAGRIGFILREIEIANVDARKERWIRALAGLKTGTRKADFRRLVAGVRPAFPGTERQWADDALSYAILLLDEHWSLYAEFTNPGPRWMTEGELRGFEIVGLRNLASEINRADFHLVLALHRASRLEGEAFEPLAVIGAVNALVNAGPEKGLQVLRAYVDLAARDPSRRSKYDLDEEKLFSVLRLVFVPREGEGLPPLRVGRPDVAPPPESADWPLFPVALRNDVPFLVVRGYEVEGRGESPMEHLGRIVRAAAWRESPLSPVGSPLDACELLTRSVTWNALFVGRDDAEHRGWARAQALKCLARQMLPPDSRDFASPKALSSDPAWEKVRRLFPGERLRWDPAAHAFE